MLAELGIEQRPSVEARLEHHLRDGHACGCKQVGSRIDAILPYELLGRRQLGTLKFPIEAAATQAHKGSQSVGG